MQFLVAVGFTLAAFIAGVLLSDTVKSWFKAKETAVATAVKADATAAVTKVEAKL